MVLQDVNEINQVKHQYLQALTKAKEVSQGWGVKKALTQRDKVIKGDTAASGD